MESCDSDRGESSRAALLRAAINSATLQIAARDERKLQREGRRLDPIRRNGAPHPLFLKREANRGALGGSGWPNEGFVWTNQGRNRVVGKQRRFAGALFPANLMETQSRHPSLSLRLAQGCTHHFLYH